jgi:outer membrane biosynthesis protein TonB
MSRHAESIAVLSLRGWTEAVSCPPAQGDGMSREDDFDDILDSADDLDAEQDDASELLLDDSLDESADEADGGITIFVEETEEDEVSPAVQRKPAPKKAAKKISPKKKAVSKPKATPKKKAAARKAVAKKKPAPKKKAPVAAKKKKKTAAKPQRKR